MDTSLYKEILFTKAEVEDRIREMAAAIVKRYKGQNTVFVCLLNGAMPFAFKLMQAINQIDPHFQPNMQSMIVSRYGSDREGKLPQVVTDLPPKYRDLTGRHLIILDDLIDQGDTIAYTEEHLQKYGAASVDYIVLVKKIKPEPAKVTATMYGFEAPDVWLTGMGMDDDRLGVEANRWAEWIAIANS